MIVHAPYGGLILLLLIMSKFTVTYQEVSLHTIEFDDEAEFNEWDNLGACIDDLHPSQITMSKCYTDISTED